MKLKQVPLADLCYLGGRKNPQTVLMCYQRPDQGTLVAALAGRRVGGDAPASAPTDTTIDTTTLVAKKEGPAWWANSKRGLKLQSVRRP